MSRTMQTTGADFVISYRYIYRDQETFLESLSEEERKAYQRGKIVTSQESVIENWIFWVTNFSYKNQIHSVFWPFWP